MTISAQSGPNINYGTVLSSSGATMEYNEQRGLSMNDLGAGIMDPRPPFAYQPGIGYGVVATKIYGWAGEFGGPVIDQIPSATSSNGIALVQASTGASGTITLATSAGSNNITSISGFVPSTYVGLSNPSSITVIGIDCAAGTAMGGLGFGSAGTVAIWDPTHSISRCLSIASGSSAIATSTGTTFTIKGFDIYGYNLTQSLTGPTSGSVVFTTKAFKYIQSITWSGATTAGSTSTMIGVTDTFGFPLRVDTPAYLTTWWGNSTASSPNAVIVTASTGAHTFASTSVATATTGDVRGTLDTSAYTPGASNGTTNRLTMFISPSVQNVQSMTLSSLANSSINQQWSGLLGVPQF